MNPDWNAAARQAVDRCRILASYTEEPGWITRTYLSAPMHDVHRALAEWLAPCGCAIFIDAAGNLRAVRGGSGDARRLIIGSHLDTVLHAGAFDGVLGVVMGVALIEALGQRELPFAIELIGFSEEEGVRFGLPFLGSRAVTGDLGEDAVAMMSGAIREFGLDPAELPLARLQGPIAGYFEFHIEQGPVLEQLGLPVGIVEAIAGQSRFEVRFEGSAAHAGTTPAHLRKDALAGAAEWIAAVERTMRDTPGLVATVGRITVEPGAPNVIAGTATMSLDIRHARDEIRHAAAQRLNDEAHAIAQSRGLRLCLETRSDLPATPMDAGLVSLLEEAVHAAGYPIHHMPSGAGHDAMILAAHVPAAMLFIQSPGGVSHSPQESVREDDVAAALACGAGFLSLLERQYA
ncbi:MAG TPA: allantoate amidohydrolase [Bryobacteraceae bacterium]